MKHGANIYKYKNPSKIVDFSSNINLHNPKKKFSISHKKLHRYSDTTFKKLKQTIAKNYNLKTSQIALYNGATKAIEELITQLPNKHIYLYAPLYGEYESAVKLTNKKLHKINRFKNLYKKVKKNSIVVFVNPSTPDGRYYNLDKLLKMWKKQNATVILDESFLEFEKLKSYRTQNYKKLYIIQSFSKFYSCAGVRVGAIFSNKKNIKTLHKTIWNLSSFDVEFLIKRLKDKKFKNKTFKKHKKAKKRLYKVLKNSKHIKKVIPSNTNFFLTKVKKPKKLFKKLLTKNILVRKCESFDFLDKNYFRFAVKSLRDVDSLCDIISK